jgi:hypothetical protein
LRPKNNKSQAKCPRSRPAISGTGFRHSALKFDDADMALRGKILQFSRMLQLSNKALGMQESPETDCACQALAKFGKIESTSRIREKVYSWQAHDLAELY